MALRRSSSSSIFLFLCFHLLAPVLYTTSDASSILQVMNCATSGNYTNGSAYSANVNQFLAALPANTVSKNGGFYNGTVGLGMDTVYGLAMCPADYSRADCGDCLMAAAGSNPVGLLSRCHGSKTVLAMFDRCLVRYSDVNFFGTPEIGAVQALLTGQLITTTAAGTYSQAVSRILSEKTSEAMNSPQRFAASAGAPYVFVQCTWDLPADKCQRCLNVLSANATYISAIRMEGQRKSYSCTVRYSNTSFMFVPFTAASGPTPESIGQTGLSAPSSSAKGSQAATVIGASIAVLVVICLAVLIAVLVYKLRRQRSTRVHVRKFKYPELADATRNFAEEEKLGAGAFGAVYKGKVTGIPEHVAIKKMTKTSLNGTEKSDAKKDFDNEIEIMSPLSHRNIIRLLGWCDDRNNLLLVYELMENGNLHDQLYPENDTTDTQLYGATDPANKPLLLDWDKRHNILIGITSGLVYLHSECKNCLLHRDIKPGNVMLDKTFNAKLCDFGLVTQVSHNRTSRTTKNIRGTIVYVDPASVANYRVCEQNDIYSFGILLLEVVCCEEPKMIRIGDFTINNLIQRVWTCFQNNKILDAADRRLRGAGQFDEQIKRVLVIGLSCVQQDRHLRPHIRRVMECLTNQNAQLPFCSVSNVPSTVSVNGSPDASTSHNGNSNEDRYSTCPTVFPAPSQADENDGTSALLSGQRSGS